MEERTMRAVRGAICVRADEEVLILDATQRLLGELLRRNDIEARNAVAIFFTATPDLRSAFPAAAARRMGLGEVPLMCAQEIAVQGALERVVRIMVIFEGGPTRPTPVYLEGAEVLRDDLA